MVYMSKQNHFLYRNRWCFLLFGIVFFLYFSPYLHNDAIAIDTWIFTNYPGSLYNWLGIGRQGGALIHRLLTRPVFALYFVQAVAFCLYIFAMVSYAKVFHEVAGVQIWKSCFFFLISMIHTIWVEQFYYTLQLCEIAIGMLLIPWIIWMIFFGKRIITYIGASILLVFIISIYQSLVIVYIACVATCYLLSQRTSMCENGKKGLTCDLKLGCKFAVVSLISYLINTVITKKFFSSNDYLNSQVRWGVDSTQECISRITSHMKFIFTGTGSTTFYSWTFAFSLFIALLTLVAFLVRQRASIENSIICILVFLVLQGTPFLLTVYGGTYPAYRAQIALPVAVACNILIALAFYKSQNEKRYVFIMTLAGLCILGNHAYTASQLQYTWSYVRHQDEQRAYQIIDRLRTVSQGEDKPVAFIGYYSAVLNNVCIVGESTHHSVFDTGGWSDTPYWDTTLSTPEYLRTFGVSFPNLQEDRIEMARRSAIDMPSWPADGCIKEFDDYIVVKLAPDDYYAMDLMEPQVSTSPVDSQTMIWDESTFGWIDDVSVEDGVLTINGWAIKRGCDSTFAAPQVHILDENGQILYTLASGTKVRTDLNTVYSDGTEYGHSGVTARAPVSELPTNIRECKVLLSITVKDKTYFFDATNSISDIEKLYTAVETR